MASTGEPAMTAPTMVMEIRSLRINESYEQPEWNKQ
jgi:hypothetical protein